MMHALTRHRERLDLCSNDLRVADECRTEILLMVWEEIHQYSKLSSRNLKNSERKGKGVKKRKTERRSARYTSDSKHPREAPLIALVCSYEPVIMQSRKLFLSYTLAVTSDVARNVRPQFRKNSTATLPSRRRLAARIVIISLIIVIIIIAVI